MFSLVQARRYKSLKTIDQPLGSFQALVGPNASGKTTFLDIIGLLGDLTRNRGEVQDTIRARSVDFEKLVWLGHESSFQLAVEAHVPDAVQVRLAPEKRNFDCVRYEIEIGLDKDINEIGINHETLWLKDLSKIPYEHRQVDLFPRKLDTVRSLFVRSKNGLRTAINKKPGGNDNYYPEGKPSYTPSFKLGRSRSALSTVPADPDSFPVSTWFKSYLESGIRSIVLNSQKMRSPSPPGSGYDYGVDGSNLPWVVHNLRQRKRAYDAWIAHVKTALGDVVDIDTVLRDDDHHRYLVITYQNGAKVPSWLASDGTLRLLALTILAYIDLTGSVLLIEEPENGIHPSAIETVMQSLQSVYNNQVVVATHSPVALSMLPPDTVLCFGKNTDGATDVVRGDRHPILANWKNGEPDFSVLFASGILS
jgi:predicted ATPase